MTEEKMYICKLNVYYLKKYMHVISKCYSDISYEELKEDLNIIKNFTLELQNE